MSFAPHNASGPVATAATLQVSALAPTLLLQEMFAPLDAPWRDARRAAADRGRGRARRDPDGPGSGSSSTIGAREAPVRPARPAAARGRVDPRPLCPARGSGRSRPRRLPEWASTPSSTRRAVRAWRRLPRGVRRGARGPDAGTPRDPRCGRRRAGEVPSGARATADDGGSRSSSSPEHAGPTSGREAVADLGRACLSRPARAASRACAAGRARHELGRAHAELAVAASRRVPTFCREADRVPLDEAAEISRAAEVADRVLFTTCNKRFSPPYAEARRLLDAAPCRTRRSSPRSSRSDTTYVDLLRSGPSTCSTSPASLWAMSAASPRSPPRSGRERVVTLEFASGAAGYGGHERGRPQPPPVGARGDLRRRCMARGRGPVDADPAFGRVRAGARLDAGRPEHAHLGRGVGRLPRAARGLPGLVRGAAPARDVL